MKLESTRTAAFLLLMLLAALSPADVVTVSAPEDVEDAPLLSGEFAGWNFGSSPLLEVGYMGGIYTEHRATSAVRFDLRGVPIAQATGATLRLYKPRDFVQMRPMRVDVYEVAPSSGAWQEAAGVFGTDGAKGADRIAPAGKAIATALISDREGAWAEFPLPASLVQRWLDDPGANAGILLMIDPKDQKQWGDHVYFHSSEHYLGRTPQLRIEGTAGPARARLRKEPKARLVTLPAANSLDGWLRKIGRLAKFSKSLKCTPEQARVFQMFDTTVRDQLIVALYQAPFQKIIAEIPPLIERGDEPAIRAKLARLHELLLKWEYIRETAWYTSGPLADVLSPRQLNQFFAGEIFGTMESSARDKGREIWKVLPLEKMPAHNRAVISDLTERLKLSSAQVRALTPPINEYELRENHHLSLFRQDLARCQELMRTSADGPVVFAAVRDLHLHHEQFLYYQSIYNTPRWTLFMEHAPVGPFAAWIADVRRDHYDRAMSGAEKRAKSGDSEAER